MRPHGPGEAHDSAEVVVVNDRFSVGAVSSA